MQTFLWVDISQAIFIISILYQWKQYFAGFTKQLLLKNSQNSQDHFSASLTLIKLLHILQTFSVHGILNTAIVLEDL